jgi:diguanylate cyclase (GGDEF)-like protein
MTSTHERRCALLAATAQERPSFRALFQSPSLSGWHVTEADSFEQARFLLQMELYEVLLLDGSLDPHGGTGGLSWLAGQHLTPVLFLADPEPGVVLDALSQGAHHWLPRGLALEHPALLGAVLEQSARHGELLRRSRRSADVLDESRQQVSRLVNLLWEASSGEERPHWLTQRNVMERLHEEVARAERLGVPMAVVLSEVQGPHGKRFSLDEERERVEWVAERVSHAKRRSDVAGHYGPHGFLLLLPGATDRGAVDCCRRLRSLFEQPAETDLLSPLHLCFGVASFSPATATVKSLLRRAEERLEQAKSVSEGIVF